MQKVKELTENENIFFYGQICGILYVLLTDSREETAMQNIIPDERYSVADEAILGAFFKLLKEKKPDRITVSDITKTAGIARSTFYNHYQDIPSLISAVEDKTIHDVFSMMENFQPKNDRDICSSYFLTLCRYTMENPFLSGLLKIGRAHV